MTRYWCRFAWLGGSPAIAADDAPDGNRAAANLADEVVPGVLIDVLDGRIASVTTNVAVAPSDAVRLDGVTLPGLANVHSHAFHRALRGRTQRDRGTFWTWRDLMYSVANRLDPDSYHRLARAVYAEMALAGVTAVGEFHYLHHAPAGTRYADPNAMGHALTAAAAEAGIRITLIDTCYLSGGLDPTGSPIALNPTQHRFSDGDAAGWADRLATFGPTGDGARLGAAIHSVRAVPPDAMPTVAAVGAHHGVLHAHVSEQQAENTACAAAHGGTPTAVLAEAGALGPHTTLVHATHLTGGDRALIGASGAGVCLCPTTERDLADGIGPAAALRDAHRVPLSLGSDSNAVIDLFEEARAMELDERLRSQVRGHFAAAELLTAATAAGHRAIGWADAGRLAPGARADLVTVDTTSVRLAGCADWPPVGADRPRPGEPGHATGTGALAALAFAATATDVRHVVVDGRQVVRDGRHLLVGDVAGELAHSIREVLS